MRTSLLILILTTGCASAPSPNPTTATEEPAATKADTAEEPAATEASKPTEPVLTDGPASQPSVGMLDTFDAPPPVGTNALCVVSKEPMTVSEGTPQREYKGKHYVFCCPGCMGHFDNDPESFIAKK